MDTMLQCREYMQTAGQKCRSVMTDHFIQKICYGDMLNRLKTGDFTGGAASPWWMLLVFIPGASLICHGVFHELRKKCSILSDGEYCEGMPPDDNVMKEEKNLLGLENKLVDELNVNAEFEVEKPEMGAIPDFTIFAEVQRSAEEQMLMRKIVGSSVKIFSLTLIGLIAHNAYRLGTSFTDSACGKKTLKTF